MIENLAVHGRINFFSAKTSAFLKIIASQLLVLYIKKIYRKTFKKDPLHKKLQNATFHHT